ncbi:MAG: hypothetical protein IT258_11435 [Saprospiraceae bacterium]|nr:hypothetical protein [Saprospiraceae bacterium]
MKTRLFICSVLYLTGSFSFGQSFFDSSFLSIEANSGLLSGGGVLSTPDELWTPAACADRCIYFEQYELFGLPKMSIDYGASIGIGRHSIGAGFQKNVINLSIRTVDINSAFTNSEAFFAPKYYELKYEGKYFYYRYQFLQTRKHQLSITNGVLIDDYKKDRYDLQYNVFVKKRHAEYFAKLEISQRIGKRHELILSPLLRVSFSKIILQTEWQNMFVPIRYGIMLGWRSYIIYHPQRHIETGRAYKKAFNNANHLLRQRL